MTVVPVSRSASDPPILAVKGALRRQMRRLRDDEPPEERTMRAAALVDHVLAELDSIPAWPTDPRVVMSFVGIRSEPDTSRLHHAWWERGGRVVVPRVAGERLDVVELRPDEQMITSSFGVPEPAGRPVPPSLVGAVIVPGLAFDRRGGRLGYGAGFYDRFLPTLAPPTLSIGIGYSFQVVAGVPCEEHDWLLDLLITDEEVVRCGHPSR